MARQLRPDEIRMRDACFHDVLQVIKHAIEDASSEDGREHLRILGAAFNDNGPEGFGYDPKEHPDDVEKGLTNG